MKVLAWVPQAFDTAPGQRFRIEQWAPHLAAQGIEIVHSAFADADLTSVMSERGSQAGKAWAVIRALGRRIWEAVSAARADLVYIFREDALLGPAVPARLLRARGIPFVFDFDDAVYVRYVSPANGFLSLLRLPGKTATLCGQARHVMVGNAHLESYARRHSRRVSIVPTSIDTKLYVPLRRGPSVADVPVIGWSGSYSTVQYLELVRPALERLARRRRFLLRVVGAPAPVVQGVDVESRPWRSETEINEIGHFDIGLMPLSDDEWARGKCGLKALQYMAMGVPPVVSPIGVNRDIVEHGGNGLLATSAEDWVACLERLLDDRVLRGEMGLRGRRTVEERYSAAAVAPQVAQIFRDAIL
jgi:glycosyltransferase involved in cell wall biosynthesis